MNLAARLSDIAMAHEVLATPEVTEALPAWATADPAMPLDVPGFSRPVPVCRVRLRDHEATLTP